MKLFDTPARYGWISLINHWLIAVLILGLIAFGLVLEGMSPSPDKGTFIQLHKMLGVLALALALIRIAWGRLQTQPGAADTDTAFAALLRKAMHTALLVATVVVPLSGVLMSLFFNHPVSLLGLYVIPAQGEVLWIAGPAHFIHEWGSYLVLAMVAAHALVSLKHHFVDRDDTLQRMMLERA